MFIACMSYRFLLLGRIIRLENERVETRESDMIAEQRSFTSLISTSPSLGRDNAGRVDNLT